uniref:Uncharacterized protein n=1 Tax=Rhipicephalus appendiculatus TaxID=34631 RepID=A0A131YC08_RHIAP
MRSGMSKAMYRAMLQLMWRAIGQLINLVVEICNDISRKKKAFQRKNYFEMPICVKRKCNKLFRTNLRQQRELGLELVQVGGM